jgi:hypothetical protein
MAPGITHPLQQKTDEKLTAITLKRCIDEYLISHAYPIYISEEKNRRSIKSSGYYMRFAAHFFRL